MPFDDQIQSRVKQRMAGANKRAHWLARNADERFVEGNPLVALQDRLPAPISRSRLRMTAGTCLIS